MTFYYYNYSEVEKCVRVVHGMYDNTEVVVIDVLKVGVELHQETSRPLLVWICDLMRSARNLHGVYNVCKQHCDL